MRRLVTVISLTVLCASAPAAATAVDRPPMPHIGTGHQAAPRAPSPATGLIVDADDPVSAAVLNDIAELVGADVVSQVPMGGSRFALRLDESVPAVMVKLLSARLSALPEIAKVGADLAATGDATPTDPLFPVQTNLYSPQSPSSRADAVGSYSIDAPTMWDATTGRKSVVVSVLDGGIVKHPDLAGQTVAGYDMITDQRFSNDGNGRDSNAADPGNYSGGKYCTKYTSTWHGSHVAGIIGALHNNKTGIAGIAPGVTLQPVRVWGSCTGTMSDIIAGIRWASGGHVDGVPDNKTPAKVINLSLSSTVTDYTCPVAYQEVIDEARSRGVLVVASAGNQSLSVLTRTPANCRGVLSVGATAPDGSPTTYTNVGQTLGMVAPGGVDPRQDSGAGIWSTVDSGTQSPKSSTYREMSGTSMAAPAVAAAAALVFSLGDFTVDQVVATLKAAAVKPPKLDDYYTCLSTDSAGNERNVCGAGILNLAGIPAPVGTGSLSSGSKVGDALTFTPGSWNGQPDDVTRQWLRDGEPIEGETSTSYTLRSADVGHSVAVRSTAHTTRFPDFSSTSPSRTVPKAVAVVELTLSASTARKNRTVLTATSTVRTVDGESGTGVVSFYVAGKKVAVTDLVDGSTGAVSLPKFPNTGKISVQSYFGGGPTIAAAWSTKRIVVVS